MRDPKTWGDGRKNEVAFNVVIDNEMTVGLAKRGALLGPVSVTMIQLFWHDVLGRKTLRCVPPFR